MPSPTRATKGVAPARATRLGWRWQPAARRARHRDARQLLQARRHPGAGRHPGALLQRGPRRPQRGRRQRRLVDAAEHPVGRRRHGHALQAGGVPLLLHLPRHQRRPGHGRHHRGRRRPLRDQREHHRQGPAGGPPGQRRHPARAPGLPDHPGGAVNAASPGDLVLVGPGVYREEVKVTIPSLVIRGTDRNQVVVDGEFRRPNAISVTADGVAVENLTVRNAVANGLFWTGVTGYRASYVTASANGDYGIYAFGSRDGVFEQSYASGSPDAGFYIGQCNPCEAVIDGVVSESNALGYSGTNASDLDIVRSVFRHNWAGIVPNTGDYELLPPFRDVRIVGNLVQDNGNRAAPGAHVEWSGFGNGIVLAGGNDSLVQRNRVLDHPNHGILVTPNLDEHFWTSAGNQVRDNVIAGSGRADLALAGPAGAGNCFSGNTVRSTVPVGLQAFQSCGGLRLPMRMDLSTPLQSLGLVAEANLDAFPHHRSQDAPPAPPQPQMAHRPGAPGRRHLRRPPRRPRPDRPAGAARRSARHRPQGAHRVRRPDPGFIRLAGDFRPLRLPAALRAVRGVGLAGTVGPGASRRPRPRRHHRVGRRGAGGTVPRRDRLPRARTAEDPGLAACHHDRWWHRRLCAHPRHRCIDRWDRLAPRPRIDMWTAIQRPGCYPTIVRRSCSRSVNRLAVPRSPPLRDTFSKSIDHWGGR